MKYKYFINYRMSFEYRIYRIEKDSVFKYINIIKERDGYLFSSPELIDSFLNILCSAGWQNKHNLNSGKKCFQDKEEIIELFRSFEPQKYLIDLSLSNH